MKDDTSDEIKHYRVVVVEAVNGQSVKDSLHVHDNECKCQQSTLISEKILSEKWYAMVEIRMPSTNWSDDKKVVKLQFKTIHKTLTYKFLVEDFPGAI
jgi:hypothetical protein